MKKNKKWGGSFKYLIPGIIAVILLSGVLLSNKFITKQTVGSIYNIEEAGDNFDNIQIGDSINYEVNGYSDWQVIGKNENNGTIDVVSKTNTEDLTLEYGQSKEYYENKFQETANKYVDNNYAISARTVNQNDLNNFSYDNDFWLNTINDIHIITSQSSFEINPKNYKMYVIPYVEKCFENYNEYNVGDIIEYSNNGVNRWVVAKIEPWNRSSTLGLIAETPIELVIESADDSIYEKAYQIIESFRNNEVNNIDAYVDTNNLQNLIPNFLREQTEKIWFFRYARFGKKNNTLTYDPSLDYYENGEFNRDYSGTLYTDTNPYTLGYRPVVTLKVYRYEEEILNENDKKEISAKLQVGDNVKYEAKGYKNWKVLSVDNDLNTVDIISGGIVKNITLSGKEDWENFEDIIQREVDQYKIGNQAKRATIATLKDLKTLNGVDKNAMARYWILSKNTFVKNDYSFGNETAKFIYYCIGAVKNSNNNSTDESVLRNIAIYADLKGDKGAVDYYSNDSNFNYYRDEINSSSYTAGLRPVITLKLDSVEKISEEETKRIEESTEKQEKVFIKEQETKNKDYKGPSKVDDSTSSTGNNSEVKTNDNDNTKKDNITDNNTSNVEKIVYKDKPFYKYGFIISLITSIIELIIIMLLLKKIKR